MLCALGQSPALSGHVDGFHVRQNILLARGLEVGFQLLARMWVFSQTDNSVSLDTYWVTFPEHEPELKHF